jgi:hypothetical protein
VTAFNIRVPMFIKRSLTSMQITQFLVGASCAMVHSFINYRVPVITVSRSSDAPASSSSAAANGSVVAATVGNVKNVKGTYEYRKMPCITSSGETFAVWLNVCYLAPLTYLFVSFFIESYLRRSSAGANRPGRNGAVDARGAPVAARRLSNSVQLAEKAGWEAAKNVEREVYGESNEEAVATEAAGNANGRASAAPSGRVLRSRKA